MSFLRKRELKGSGNEAIHNVVHLIVMVVSELKAGTIQMSEVLGVNRQP